MSHIGNTVSLHAETVKMPFERETLLDPDQSTALHRFVDDLTMVLTDGQVSAEYFERSLSGLSKAYHAALITGKWNLFVALLADALDHLQSTGSPPSSHASWRLRSMVRENADLLPPEMLHLRMRSRPLSIFHKRR